VHDNTQTSAPEALLCLARHGNNYPSVGLEHLFITCARRLLQPVPDTTLEKTYCRQLLLFSGAPTWPEKAENTVLVFMKPHTCVSLADTGCQYGAAAPNSNRRVRRHANHRNVSSSEPGQLPTHTVNKLAPIGIHEQASSNPALMSGSCSQKSMTAQMGGRRALLNWGQTLADSRTATCGHAKVIKAGHQADAPCRPHQHNPCLGALDRRQHTTNLPTAVLPRQDKKATPVGTVSAAAPKLASCSSPLQPGSYTATSRIARRRSTQK